MMAEPSTLRELCRTVGLSAYYSADYGDNFSQVVSSNCYYFQAFQSSIGSIILLFGLYFTFEQELDQIFVLTVLLENRRLSLIVQFASKWFDGSFENLGCGLETILKWIVSLTATIRSAADPHWCLMFSHRIDDLPPETFHFIHYSNFVWTQLKALLWTILRPLPLGNNTFKLSRHYNYIIIMS